MQDKAFAAYILATPGVMPAEVSSHLNVSVRSVRNYVRQTNDAMDGFASIDLKRGSGYVLTVTDRPRFDAWMQDARPLEDDELPQTPQQRVSYLLNDLLMRTDWITLEELTKVIFVSRAAISNDLKEVERVLDRFGLALEKRPHYGIRVTGPEMARRVCLANVIMNSRDQAMPATGAQTGHASSVPAAVTAESKLVETVAACVEHVTEREHFQINSVSYQNLLVHIAVALLRVKDDCYVPMDSVQLDKIKDSSEYPLAQKVAAAIGEATGIDLPDEEVAYIAIHLAGKQSLTLDADDEEGLVISSEVWDVVSEMLECVWNVFRFDFRDDLELRMNLARHIVPLEVRLRYDMNLKNPLLGDIKSRYPLAYSMAADAGAVISERFEAKLSDDETGYIALAFALALERRKTQVPKKRILVVCASGAGSARLLEYRCRQEFGDYIGSIETCDVLNIGKVDFSAIDYVFTTVPLPGKLPVPVCEVQHFLDEREIMNVRDFLRSAQLDESSIQRYFDANLFFPHLPFRTKQGVLDYLLDRVGEQRDVYASYREAVWEREGTVATSFGNDVAMPHPLTASSSETFVCVGLLDHPVAWDDFGRTVRAVFLSFFAADGGAELQGFYGKLADLLVSKTAIQTLLEHQSWATLTGLLARLPAEEPET